MNTKSFKTIIKTIVLVMILIMDISLIKAGKEVANRSAQGEDVTYDAKNVEEDYYERNFAWMIYTMDENLFYNSDMNVYREAKYAYILKMRCEIYQDSGANKEFDKAYTELKAMADNCEPENAKLFGEFVNQVNK